MKKTLLLVSLGVGLSLCASGQGFINLNFERASTAPSSLGYPFLEWSTAAPGWSHSFGDDTGYVYYQQGHLGTSQMFLLMDSTSPVWAPGTQLAGNYSLAMQCGRLSNSDYSSPWVCACISQMGTIPGTTRSIRLLATGPLQVLMNGLAVPLVSLGGNQYGGNIPDYAGQAVTLTLMNSNPGSLENPYQWTVVDNITFSSTLVPEPSGLAFAGLSLISFLARKRAWPH